MTQSKKLKTLRKLLEEKTKMSALENIMTELDVAKIINGNYEKYYLSLNFDYIYKDLFGLCYIEYNSGIISWMLIEKIKNDLETEIATAKKTTKNKNKNRSLGSNTRSI